MTPFEDALQEAIIETYGREGFECVAERHLDSDDTFGYAAIPPADTEAMIRAVAGAGPEAIAAVCTNLKGAPHVQAMEAECGRPVYDSVAAALWGTLALAGVDPSRVAGWGELFSVTPASLERLGAQA